MDNEMANEIRNRMDFADELADDESNPLEDISELYWRINHLENQVKVLQGQVAYLLSVAKHGEALP